MKSRERDGDNGKMKIMAGRGVDVLGKVEQRVHGREQLKRRRRKDRKTERKKKKKKKKKHCGFFLKTIEEKKRSSLFFHKL